MKLSLTSSASTPNATITVGSGVLGKLASAAPTSLPDKKRSTMTDPNPKPDRNDRSLWLALPTIVISLINSGWAIRHV